MFGGGQASSPAAAASGPGRRARSRRRRAQSKRYSQQNKQKKYRKDRGLISRSRGQNSNFRIIFGQNRGRKRTPCQLPINLDKFSASDANSEPNLCICIVGKISIACSGPPMVISRRSNTRLKARERRPNRAETRPCARDFSRV